MKKFQLILITIIFTFFAQSVFAQYTPKKGSKERKAIMNALRIPVKRELKKPVLFGDVQLKVKRNWAIVYTATPLKPNGRKFNYRGSVSRYAKCINQGDDDCGDPQYSAILKKVKRNWRVLKFGSGATDYWIGGACSEMKGCPKELQ